MLSAAVAMSEEAGALDCSKTAFWTLYDKNPSQDFSGAYYTATAVLLEEQIARAGYRVRIKYENMMGSFTCLIFCKLP
jgi:hypothetical protein